MNNMDSRRIDLHPRILNQMRGSCDLNFSLERLECFAMEMDKMLDVNSSQCF